MRSVNLGPLGRISIERPTQSASGATTVDTENADLTTTADEAAQSPTTTDSGQTTVRSRSLKSVAATAVCIVLLIAGVATGAWLTASNDDRNAVIEQGPELSKQVSSQVTQMLSYDYATVATELPKSETGLTEKFRPEFHDLITKTVIPSASEKRIVTRATVVGTSIVSQTDGDAKLLLFVNQVTTSSEQPEPATTGSRIVVTATQHDDRWLVDALKPV